MDKLGTQYRIDSNANNIQQSLNEETVNWHIMLIGFNFTSPYSGMPWVYDPNDMIVGQHKSMYIYIYISILTLTAFRIYTYNSDKTSIKYAV